ncbi:MAG: flagellar basal body rod protein FlgC [Deltaproteobacteria bacterium]|nr:flagellar basal body rod protein FlgC [Deltaproteobacteria bacterium]
MSFLLPLDISSSGLETQRRRMDIIASNLANIETTRTEDGGPYRRKIVMMGPKKMGGADGSFYSRLEGVMIDDVAEDQSPFKKIYNPGHPDANKEGYLLKPNVDLVVEITNMLMARRVFEANIAAIKTTKQMALKAFEIGR